MASRRLALAGAHEGPWVSTRTIKQPVLRTNAEVELTLVRGGDHERFSFSPGEHPVSAAEWMRVRCLQATARPIAEIVES